MQFPGSMPESLSFHLRSPAQERDIQLGRSQLLRDLGIAGTEAEAALSGSAAELEAANVEAVAKILMQIIAGK